MSSISHSATDTPLPPLGYVVNDSPQPHSPLEFGLVKVNSDLGTADTVSLNRSSVAIPSRAVSGLLDPVCDKVHLCAQHVHKSSRVNEDSHALVLHELIKLSRCVCSQDAGVRSCSLSVRQRLPVAQVLATTHTCVVEGVRKPVAPSPFDAQSQVFLHERPLKEPPTCRARVHCGLRGLCDSVRKMLLC